APGTAARRSGSTSAARTTRGCAALSTRTPPAARTTSDHHGRAPGETVVAAPGRDAGLPGHRGDAGGPRPGGRAAARAAATARTARPDHAAAEPPRPIGSAN